MTRDIRQSLGWQRCMSALGWDTTRVGQDVGYLKRIPFLGSVIKFPRCLPSIDVTRLLDIAYTNDTFLVKIEPTILSSTDFERFQKHGFISSPTSTMPTSTLQIDLAQSIKQLWKNVRPSTQTKINRGERLELDIVESDDIDEFAMVWSRSTRRRGWLLGQSSTIKELWLSFLPSARLLLLCKNKATFLAGVFLLFHEKTAYYMYAFSTDAGRQMPASHLLAWESIVRSKKERMVTFDFEGIADDSTPSSWKGFTFFKAGFGGRKIHFPGSFTRRFRWARFLPSAVTM